MSDKRVGRYQEAETWKRWEMSSFDAPAAAAQPTVPQQPIPRLADIHAEVQRLRDAAQLAGHAEGYATGHTQGLLAGKEEGGKAGHEEGYAAGFEAGLASGRERAQQEIAQLHELANASALALATVDEEMGQALIALSIRIAEQVLRSTLDAQPEKILDLVRDITHLDTSKEAILKLRIHPDDLDLVDQYLQHDIGVSHWRLVADAGIERGGCLAQTVLGNIDATLQTRWERVTSALGQTFTAAKKV